ncbi:hypothetical protein [Candidatus Nitronereus thalassa]|uniref:Uncharacterized protein n=1 Tax=Candidatus Nitronereus thalassa TaxID=3020898 RepID=A0ABU3KD73_9BACT|nr:hypothetical protein [Candidatus Nitronereus thalassa]MDT7044192.1 hypothetical protein [Candidatus Nitronereus thalassa]
MKHRVLAALYCLTFSVILANPIHSAPPSLPSAIDQFVAKIFPLASHYHWVVNNAQKETSQEMILDINTFVTKKETGDTPIENRFLLLVMDGEVRAAQKIPLDSTVDCGKDTEI